MTEQRNGTITVYEPWGEEETIEVEPFHEDCPVGEVSVSVGCKINTGNYENVSLHVSVKLPCVATEEGARLAQEAATRLVDEKLMALRGEVVG